MMFFNKIAQFSRLICNRLKLMLKNLFFLSFLIIILSSCKNNEKKDGITGNQEKFEPNADVRARNFADKNPITLFKDSKDKNTNFEFGNSNVLWRASLKTLDFIPLATVDYSGGIIITDWYSEGKLNKEQIKIQIKFVSTELRSESIQVVSYKKICEGNNDCTNIAGNENFNKEIKDLIINTARQIKIEENKKNKS
jgi:hypothetical protein